MKKLRVLTLARSDVFDPLLAALQAHGLEMERVSTVDTARRCWSHGAYDVAFLELACVADLPDAELPRLPVVLLAEHFRVGDAHGIVGQAIYYADHATPAEEILEVLEAYRFPTSDDAAGVPPP